MAHQPPQTAAAAIFAFFSDFSAALFLRRSFYARVVDDPGSWRRAAVVVILAALATDSMELYSKLDEFLVRQLVNWSLLPIMMIALARWCFGTSIAWGAARILRQQIEIRALLRSSGYAYAPVALRVVPAIVYSLDLLPVTYGMFLAVHNIILVWTLVALTYAALAAGVKSRPAAVAVAIVLFLSANMFDVLLDLLLGALIGDFEPIAIPGDGIAFAAELTR